MSRVFFILSRPAPAVWTAASVRTPATSAASVLRRGLPATCARRERAPRRACRARARQRVPSWAGRRLDHFRGVEAALLQRAVEVDQKVYLAVGTRADDDCGRSVLLFEPVRE